MIEPIQIILIVFILFALSRAWLRYREGKIKRLEFLFWLIIWVSAIVAVAAPRAIGFVSQAFGIGRPADLILYVAVILLFYLVFRIYVFIDALQEDTTRLVREIAIKKERKK
jgi:hypothetical protein